MQALSRQIACVLEIFNRRPCDRARKRGRGRDGVRHVHCDGSTVLLVEASINGITDRCSFRVAAV